jgi:excisionase family DNA binding protein
VQAPREAGRQLATLVPRAQRPPLARAARPADPLPRLAAQHRVEPHARRRLGPGRPARDAAPRPAADNGGLRHLSPDYLLREIDKPKLGIAPEAAEEAPIDERLLHPLLQTSGEDSKTPTASPEIVNAAGALERAGDGGRTRDPRLGKGIGGDSDASTGSDRLRPGRHSVGLATARADDPLPSAPLVPPNPLPFASPLASGVRAQSVVRLGEARRLMTVREAAERLRVRPVTVYRLCARGTLPHLRVSNAIRLRVEDLEDFVHR